MVDKCETFVTFLDRASEPPPPDLVDRLRALSSSEDPGIAVVTLEDRRPSKSPRRGALVVAAAIVAGVSVGAWALASSSPQERYAADSSTEQVDRNDYLITVGGAALQPEAVEASLAGVRAADSRDPSVSLSAREIDEFAASAAVFDYLLVRYAESNGFDVSESDVDQAILSASALSPLGESTPTIEPSEALRDLDLRQSMRAALLRSRGLSALISASGASSLAEPSGREYLRSWLVEQVRIEEVTADTPTGPISGERLVELARGPGQSWASD